MKFSILYLGVQDELYFRKKIQIYEKEHNQINQDFIQHNWRHNLIRNQSFISFYL